MQSGIPAFCAHRESVGIGGNCRNSWSLLPIPELQTSHGCVNDHLQSLNKCKAEFPHFLHNGNHWESVGIGRNSWSFLVIPAYSGITNISWMCKWSFTEVEEMQSGIPAFFAHRESLENAGIPGHSCLFRNYKYVMDGQMIIYRAWINAKRNSCIFCTSGINRKCTNSWSFLPIPESQISHESPNDYLSSLNKCKAEFLHFLHIRNH